MITASCLIANLQDRYSSVQMPLVVWSTSVVSNFKCSVSANVLVFWANAAVSLAIAVVFSADVVAV